MGHKSWGFTQFLAHRKSSMLSVAVWLRGLWWHMVLGYAGQFRGHMPAHNALLTYRLLLQQFACQSWLMAVPGYVIMTSPVRTDPVTASLPEPWSSIVNATTALSSLQSAASCGPL